MNAEPEPWPGLGWSASFGGKIYCHNSSTPSASTTAMRRRLPWSCIHRLLVTRAALARNRVVATATERIAAQQSPSRERTTDDDPALAHGGLSVLRARR